MRPAAAIAKEPRPGGHVFKAGGTGRRPADPRFLGPCCGGTRQPGDFGKAKCTCCTPAFEAYICQGCRKPLALTPAQRQQIQEKKAAAAARRLDPDMAKEVQEIKEQFEADRAAAAARPNE
jgi:predicted amidophosphoribosyltransferase